MRMRMRMRMRIPAQSFTCFPDPPRNGEGDHPKGGGGGKRRGGLADTGEDEVRGPCAAQAPSPDPGVARCFDASRLAHPAQVGLKDCHREAAGFPYPIRPFGAPSPLRGEGVAASVSRCVNIGGRKRESGAARRARRLRRRRRRDMKALGRQASCGSCRGNVCSVLDIQIFRNVLSNPCAGALPRGAPARAFSPRACIRA